MTTLALVRPTMYSEEEYLRLENEASERSEFLQGMLMPKEAGAPDHNPLAKQSPFKQSALHCKWPIFTTGRRM